MASYQDPNKRVKTNGGGPAVPSRSSASVSRPASNKLRLTVKAPPSKLRQATSGEHIHAIPPNPYADASESDATPQPVNRVARSTRNPRTVVEPESDEEMDDVDDDDEQDDQDDNDDEEEEDDADGSEEDAEGEDDDMDELQKEPSPAPIIEAKGKPTIKVQAPAAPLKSVEDQEMEDDEELSELESNEDEVENELGEDEEDDNSDDDSDIDNSRSATPDLSKLTRRQRATFEEEQEGDLLALSNEAQKKKVFTEEEHAMRRQEMARRRKNLSEKRNEEEKMDTINKLLKKPAPKRRTRAEIIAAQHAAELAGTPGAEDGAEEKPDPLFVRWTNTRNGSKVGVPEEWLEAPPGDLFRDSQRNVQTGSRMMVEEVS